MKLIGFTTTYNVRDIIDVIMPYVVSLGYDRFIVYDNMSTDGTPDLLSNYPFVEIRQWDTGGKLDEIAKRDLEINSFWECKKLEAEGEDVWMTWTDFDEVIFYYHDRNFKAFLDGLSGGGFNVFYDALIQPMLPNGHRKKDVYDFIHDGNFAHEYEGVVVNHQYSKPILFHVNEFDNLYFVPGNHFALSEDDNVKNAVDFPMTIFHFKYFFKDYANTKNTEYDVNKNAPDGYVDIHKNVCNLLYASSYPIKEYFHDKWKTININVLFRGNNNCWGELIYKDKFVIK